MTRGFKQLVTASLATILLGGLISPNIAYADTTAATTATTTKADSQTYTISSVELAYARQIQDQQVTANYIMQKDLSTDPDGDAHSLTTAQLADDAYMRAFAKYNGNSEQATLLPVVYQLFFAQPTFDSQTTAAELLYPELGQEFDTIDNYVKNLSLKTYIAAWWMKNFSQYQIDANHYAQMQADYHNSFRAKLVDFGTDESTLEDSDEMFTDQAHFKNHYTYLNQAFIPGLLKSAGFSQDASEHELAKLNPEISAAETQRALEQPVVSYLTPQADGTFQVSGLFMSLMPAVYSFDDTLLPPTTDPDPVPTPDPTPTPTTSQPVTVHYVDTSGQKIAPDRTLTGDLGATYQAPVRDVPNFKLKTTPANATGRFTSVPQTVTYVYQQLLTSGAGADVAAPKGTVIYATKKIGLYRTATFTQKSRQRWYAKKSRQNRPMFVVTGYAKSKNGVQRYRVKDVNHHSRTAGKTGYVTANRAYTAPIYYATKHKTITVINPSGVNSYARKNLTGKQHHYRQGQTLTVKKIVRHNLTTRFVLSNGRYVTANKTLVQAGKVAPAKRVAAKGALNRYGTVQLTQRNRHYTRKSHATFVVRGWDYSNANNFNKGDTLRYRVAGGYISGNSKFVREVR